MQHGSKTRQTGLSFFTLLFVVVVLASVGVLTAQVIPTLVEYQSVIKAVQRAKEGTSPAEVRAIFDKAAQIENISSISAKDLELVREGEGFQVRFAYTREIHMVGPAYLLLKYAGQSK